MEIRDKREKGLCGKREIESVVGMTEWNMRDPRYGIVGR
jgi:hypothetical protein